MFIIFFILGLIIGSFINSLVYRLNAAETLMGRSHCPRCRAQIRWYDNVPLLSFLALGTRCRDCDEKISWQYPLVELATGVVFAFIGHYFFTFSESLSWMSTAYYLVVFSLLLIVFVYDFKFMEIPMLVIWIGVALSIVYFLLFDYLTFNPIFGTMSMRIFSGALAGILAFLFFFSLSFFSKERWMGMGDAYVALLAGLVAGWPGIILALLLSFAIGSIYGIILVATKKKTMKSQVPFAPFLVAGTFIALLILTIFPGLMNLFVF
jgi:prepilin signal peptidase PulO-like enzyme (type II secretory pathway)